MSPRRHLVRISAAGFVVAVVASVAALLGGPIVGAVGQAPPAAEQVVRPGPASTTAATPSPSSSPAPRPLRVVALGDSVTSGYACDCDAFPVQYGRMLARRTGAQVRVDNEGTAGLDTAGLVSQLQDTGVASQVSKADVVLVTIGANDFGDHHDDVTSGTCGAATDCVGDEMTSMRAGLKQALDRVRAELAGRPATVLVTGYWNVFEDGAVARQAAGSAGLQASVDLTRHANTVIEQVATGAGARYVDLFAPFQAHPGDITDLLAEDGDHPDAAGHGLIARTLLQAGQPVLAH